MKKLFTNDRFFQGVTLSSCITGLLYAVLSTFSGIFTIEDTISLSLTTFCTIALFISYRQHSKNVMKALMGALLGMQVVMNTYGITGYSLLYDRIFAYLYVLLTIGAFITHLLINSDHHPSPAAVRVNQIIFVLLFVVGMVWDIVWIPACANAVDVLFLLFAFLSCSTRYAVIVCVESRLDAYRLDREAAGWTEEAGYPEGYVHEYEKK